LKGLAHPILKEANKYRNSKILEIRKARYNQKKTKKAKMKKVVWVHRKKNIKKDSILLIRAAISQE